MYELRALLSQATGVTLDVINDCGMNFITGDFVEDIDEDGVLFNDNCKYISLGDTILLRRAGLSADEKELKSNGYKIKTVKNCVFIYGATLLGTSYGVYGFLRELLNFDYFYYDSLYIDEVKELPFKELDITKIADLERVPLSYGFSEWDRLAVRRYGFALNNESSIAINGLYGHNFIWGIFYPVKYTKTHPKWYYTADNPRQPCFTAHGDEKELDAMIQECSNIVTTELMKNQTKTMINLAIEDHFQACQCEHCAKAKEKYGSHAGAMVDFTNRVVRKVKNWFETQEGNPYKRKMSFFVYAYLDYTDAPVVYDEKTKEYVPTVQCDDDVIPVLAPIRADYQFSFYHKENEKYYKNIENWRKVAPNDLSFFHYDTNYDDFLVPYNTFDSMQENYRLGKECKTSYYYNLGQSPQRNYSTGWSILKVYLQSKLAWDVNADLEYYKDKFFNYYFKEGALFMRKWFEECLNHMRFMRDEQGAKGYNSLFLNVAKKEYWPKDALLRWIGYANEAITAVENQTDRNYYQQFCIKKHILCERISPLYLITKLYKDELPESEYENYIKLFANDISTLGISNYGEVKGLDVLYGELFE